MSALAEERLRLARELHDGVIQEIVALAYGVDDVASLLDDGPARDAIVALRSEVARLACVVRQSVEDLRTEPELPDGLPAALSSYVGEVGRSGELRVHFDLDERGTQPLGRAEVEVLKVAQEAITNVRWHAHAINLWVRLVTDGPRLLLVVEDDGIGTVAERSGHFGLRGMRERAEGIGADFAIDVRQDGGTVVTLSRGFTATFTSEGDGDDRHDLARR